jgi:hypothetical protein
MELPSLLMRESMTLSSMEVHLGQRMVEVVLWGTQEIRNKRSG